MLQIASNTAKVKRGPYLSVTIPIITRAGIVNATLRIRSVLISLLDNPKLVAITANNGAWLNQTMKVIKKAIQLKCNIFIFPVNDNSLMPAEVFDTLIFISSIKLKNFH